MPFPGALDDGVERLELWFPSKLALDFVRGSNEARRVPWTAWLFFDFDLASGDFAAGGDYFTNTRSAAGAEVVKSARVCAERQNMCARKIENVNVIANTCAVGCVIIGAVNFDIWPLTKRH